MRVECIFVVLPTYLVALLNQFCEYYKFFCEISGNFKD